ncbi:MAG: MarR family winged helix-turn-helix transcriptional regulator [Azospirillaceae bacterium]
MVAKPENPEVNWELLTQTLRPENNPGFLLWQVTNLWQRRQRAALDEVGITHVQFILMAGLAWLQQREGAVSQSRLAQFCKTDPMMTSQVVRSLEEQGLMMRTLHPADKRARQLELTDAGIDVLNRAMPLVLETDAIFFNPMGDGQPDMIEALRRLWRSGQPSNTNARR